MSAELTQNEQASSAKSHLFINLLMRQEKFRSVLTVGTNQFSVAALLLLQLISPHTTIHHELQL